MSKPFGHIIGGRQDETPWGLSTSPVLEQVWSSYGTTVYRLPDQRGIEVVRNARGDIGEVRLVSADFLRSLLARG